MSSLVINMLQYNILYSVSNSSGFFLIYIFYIINIIYIINFNFNLIYFNIYFEIIRVCSTSKGNIAQLAINSRTSQSRDSFHLHSFENNDDHDHFVTRSSFAVFSSFSLEEISLHRCTLCISCVTSLRYAKRQQ